MTLSEIYTEIGQLGGDPSLDSYSTEIANFFVSAMSQLIKDKDAVNYDDISPLRRDLNKPVSAGYSYLKINNTNFPNILLVLDVSAAPGDNIFWERTAVKEMARINTNPLMQLGAEEARWAKENDRVHFLRAARGGSTNAIISVIDNPDPDDWSPEKSLVSMGYGIGFLKQCIILAAKLLRQSIGVEEL